MLLDMPDMQLPKFNIQMMEHKPDAENQNSYASCKTRLGLHLLPIPLCWLHSLAKYSKSLPILHETKFPLKGEKEVTCLVLPLWNTSLWQQVKKDHSSRIFPKSNNENNMAMLE